MPEFAHLLPVGWKESVRSWLIEDAPSFDIGGYVVGEDIKTAHLYGKDDGVLAGVPFAKEIFEQLGCSVNWSVKEGDWIMGREQRVVVAEITGPARCLLLGERTALNILARCSGIATRARRLRNIADEHGFKGAIAATRKTTPGFRVVEKYGVLVGGCDPHRYDLSSMVMLKDNHVWSVGSVARAVKYAREVAGFSVKIEVECRSIAEAHEAVNAGADVIMLDNFQPAELVHAAKRCKEAWSALGKAHVIIEASGGITEDTIPSYFSPDVDVLSLGSLTQGVPHIDFSMKILK